jgi:hypothetical protein
MPSPASSKYSTAVEERVWARRIGCNGKEGDGCWDYWRTRHEPTTWVRDGYVPRGDGRAACLLAGKTERERKGRRDVGEQRAE